MKALVILNYSSDSWSPFLPLTCLYGKNELLCVYVQPSGVFSWEKNPPDYPCKSYDHDHQWADLVIAWLSYKDKRKCEHKVVRLVFVYILLSTYFIGYKQTWYSPDVR